MDRSEILIFMDHSDQKLLCGNVRTFPIAKNGCTHRVQHIGKMQNKFPVKRQFFDFTLISAFYTRWRSFEVWAVRSRTTVDRSFGMTHGRIKNSKFAANRPCGCSAVFLLTPKMNAILILFPVFILFRYFSILIFRSFALRSFKYFPNLAEG